MSKVYIVPIHNEKTMVAIKGLNNAMALATKNKTTFNESQRFSTIEEAINWAHSMYPQWKISNTSKSIVKGPKKENKATKDDAFVSFSAKQLKTIFNKKSGIAFTDGSFKNNIMGCGIVLFMNGEKYSESVKYINNEKGNSVTAELEAAKIAIIKAISLGGKRLIICYDCEAVKQAAEVSGASQEMKEFHTFYSSIKSIIDITFMKVKGHSNVAMNTYADQLAGAATK